MRHLKLISILVFALIFSKQSFSQIIIQLNNGDIVEGKSFEILKKDSLVLLKTKKGKIKDFPIFQVYSISDSLNQETILYKKDGANNIFTPLQMKDFIRGEQAASKNFNPIIPYIIGGTIALSSCTVLGLAGISPTYSIFIPGTYCAILAISEMKVSKYKPYASEPDNEFYMEGFKRIAIEKRLRRNLIGAGVGFVIGLLIFR